MAVNVEPCKAREGKGDGEKLAHPLIAAIVIEVDDEFEISKVGAECGASRLTYIFELSRFRDLKAD